MILIITANLLIGELKSDIETYESWIKMLDVEDIKLRSNARSKR